ncbi:phosphatase PAP2 family protein [Spirosoma jeollabukense]
MKRYVTTLILSLHVAVSWAQTDTTTFAGYRVNWKVKLPLSVGALALSTVGFRQLDRTASLTAEQVLNLDPARINAFDRPVAFYDPARFPSAQKRSDLFLNISIASPLLLLLGKEMRQDALDLLTLYTTAHTLNNLIYFGAAFPIRRARPLTYNSGLPLEEKTGQAKSNSFYSGHVSFSTTATFFGAKVLTDYYHIRGWKRIAVFTVAAVPPILVGVNRMHAGKHFRTDVLTGFVVGAACGILVPQLHKAARKSSRLSWRTEFMPNGGKGINFTYSL